MPHKYEAHARSIQEVFAGPVFVAPAYQRRFCWTAVEGGRLLDDLVRANEDAFEGAFDDEGDYFLGTILLVDPSGGSATGGLSDDRVLDIVDGQQRLVTLSILLAVLRDLLAEARPEAAKRLHRLLTVRDDAARNSDLRVQLRGNDCTFLREVVVASGVNLTEHVGGTSNAPEQCILGIREHFASELGEWGMSALEGFASFVLQKCSVVVVVTNHIDRAHRMFTVLNDAGKALKRNEILKAELLGAIAEEQRAPYLALWEDCEARVGDDFEQLFSHIRVIHGRNGGHVIAGIRALVKSSGGAARFMDEVLRPAADVFVQIKRGEHRGRPQSKDIATLLRAFDLYSGADWIAPVMAYVLRNPDESEGLLTFLRVLDRLSMGLRILGYGADKRTQRMTAITKLVLAGEPVDGESSVYALSRDELRRISYNLRDLYTRNQQVCKLLLVRLNDSMPGSAQRLDPANVSVEHVLPLKPAARSQWREWFPDADARNTAAASLGNLILVPPEINDKAANHEFARKIALYFENLKEPPSYLTDMLRGKKTWREVDILQSEAAKMRQVYSLWRFGEPVEAVVSPPARTWRLARALSRRA